MGDNKEIFFLFVLTFCLLSFGLQPKASDMDSATVASAMTASVDHISRPH